MVQKSARQVLNDRGWAAALLVSAMAASAIAAPVLAPARAAADDPAALVPAAPVQAAPVPAAPGARALPGDQLGALSTATVSVATPARTDPCAGKIGVSRTVTLDTRGGPHFGRIGVGRPPTFLRPKEVVLTFDDGPNPRATGRILDILKAHCATATFFVVGNMARWHPDLLRRIAAEGHTIAGHTERHPMPFSQLSQREGEAEIERGFASLTRVLGAPPAALFRFPGLDHTAGHLAYLSRRDVTALSVDVIGGDTRADATAASVTRNILGGARRQNGGVLLLHDPLRRTARALPAILTGLREGGFSLVHLQTAAPFRPLRGSGDVLMSGLSDDGTTGAAAEARAPRARPRFVSFSAPAMPAIY